MFKKKVKNYVELGVLTSGGAAIMGAMNQGEIGSKIATPVSNMMGPMISADMGMSIMGMANKYSKGGKPVKIKKGKHMGYGEWL